jgi:hypothetical protein
MQGATKTIGQITKKYNLTTHKIVWPEASGPKDEK